MKARSINRTKVLISQLQSPDWNSKEICLIGTWQSPETQSDALREKLNVLEYHWDNRAKLESDVNLIKDYIYNLKEVLYPALNAIHKSNYSNRYWDVLTSEWIHLYTQVMFDRWSVIETVFKVQKYPNLLNRSYYQNNTPLDTNSFIQSANLNRHWNSNLFQDIFDAFCGMNKADFNMNRKIDDLNHRSLNTPTFKRKLLAIFSKIYVAIVPESKGILVQSPYLSQSNFLKLCLKLKALMFFNPENHYEPTSNEVSGIMRDSLSKLLRNNFSSKPFHRFLVSGVVDYLPAVYLEEYLTHKKFALDRYFNYFPRLIVTANNHFLDEEWKSWAASAAEQGSKIVILQHGGHYGHSRFSLIQEYEIELGDRFLTWGWTLINNKKVKRAPANKLIGSSIQRYSKETCLIVTFESSVYSSWLASIPVGPQVINSREMTIKLLDSLDESILECVRLRTYPTDYGLKQKELIKLLYPRLSITPTQTDFFADLKDARVAVFNYLSTTFIEAVKSDVPSVVFLNPLHWEVTDRYESIFLALKNAGVLHFSSESCANFISTNWDLIENWWSDTTTRHAIASFIDVFGYTGVHPIIELARAIIAPEDT
jgi:putative transferase (TIGR04331 family)